MSNTDIPPLKVNRNSTTISQVRFYHYRQVCERYLVVRVSVSELSANAIAWSLLLEIIFPSLKIFHHKNEISLDQVKHKLLVKAVTSQIDITSKFLRIFLQF